LIIICCRNLIVGSSANGPCDKAAGNETFRYAVFSCDTPDGTAHRKFDYAFYLPLTALAWERIGFKSIVVIIGKRADWTGNAILNHVLEALEWRSAVVMFVDAPPKNRRMLSQTVRLFVANMNEWAERDDYLITSDSDLWPLRQAHFTPEVNKSLVLVHSDCCDHFNFQNKSYRMLPMGNIGANASTWRQIMNYNHSKANDSESILNYYEEKFGPIVNEEVTFASANWYFDQKMISIRIQEWIDRHSDRHVFRKSDSGYKRINRSHWNINMTSLDGYFDSHLPLNGYLPETWKKIRPLIILMFGENSWQLSWADEYAQEFYQYIEYAG